MLIEINEILFLKLKYKIQLTIKATIPAGKEYIKVDILPVSIEPSNMRTISTTKASIATIN